jgi:hypothetical protein
VDFERRLDALLLMMADLQRKAATGSVLVLQVEKGFDPARLPDPGPWDRRIYGRNELLIWVKEPPAAAEPTDQP